MTCPNTVYCKLPRLLLQAGVLVDEEELAAAVCGRPVSRHRDSAGRIGLARPCSRPESCSPARRCRWRSDRRTAARRCRVVTTRWQRRVVEELLLVTSDTKLDTVHGAAGRSSCMTCHHGSSAWSVTVPLVAAPRRRRVVLRRGCRPPGSRRCAGSWSRSALEGRRRRRRARRLPPCSCCCRCPQYDSRDDDRTTMICRRWTRCADRYGARPAPADARAVVAAAAMLRGAAGSSPSRQATSSGRRRTRAARSRGSLPLALSAVAQRRGRIMMRRPPTFIGGTPVVPPMPCVNPGTT